MGRLSRQVWPLATTFHTPSGPVAAPVAMGVPTVTNEPLPAGCAAGAAAAPPSTGWPESPGAGVPGAPMAGRLFCCTVEDCTGCACDGWPMTLRLAVLVRPVDEHPASKRAIAAKPATEEAPRFQTCIAQLLPRRA